MSSPIPDLRDSICLIDCCRHIFNASLSLMKTLIQNAGVFYYRFKYLLYIKSNITRVVHGMCNGEWCCEMHYHVTRKNGQCHLSWVSTPANRLRRLPVCAEIHAYMYKTQHIDKIPKHNSQHVIIVNASKNQAFAILTVRG